MYVSYAKNTIKKLKEKCFNLQIVYEQQVVLLQF